MAWVVEVSGRRAAAGVMSSLRAELVARRLRRDGARLATEPGGELATAAVQGVDGLEAYFARYLPQVVLAVVVPVAVVAWTATVDPTSAVIVAITVPVVPVFMALIGRAAAHRSRQRWAALTVLGAHFLDVVRGLPTLRAFNRGEAQLPKIADAADRYRRTTMGTLRLSFLSGAVLDLAATLSTALVAVTLGVRLVDGQVGLRPALTVLLLVPELYAPLRQLGSLFHASADGLAAATRILEVLDEDGPPPVADAAPAVPTPAVAPAALPNPAREAVRLRDVSVRYAGREVPALDGVDLTLAPGELLAVTGPSGAGKTTLGQVLLGIRAPDGGAVVVGERALTAGDLDGWRRHLAWAPQHPVLVHASVAANIALGAPGAGRERVEAAARAAGAHAFVVALPRGYDTVLGSGGRALSPGQRQRLGLARALLRDAPLTVLDEPTAHLDDASVGHVARTLARPAGPGHDRGHHPRRAPDGGRRPPGGAGAGPAGARRGRGPAGRARRGGAGTVTDPSPLGGVRDLARLLGLRPRRLVAPVALGAASVLASAALVGLSAYLICRASQRPPILSLTMLIVGVRAVALVRPLARYAERLSAHDLAFRTLGDVRTAVFARIEPLAPEGIEHYRDGDLLSRMVADVDEMQDLVLRIVVPVAVAVPTGVVLVAATGVVEPGAAAVLAGGLVAGAVVPAWVAYRLTVRAQRRQGALRAALTADLVDAFDAAPELWLNEAEGAAAAVIAEDDRSLVAAAAADARGAGCAEALATIISGGTALAVLAVAAAAADSGRLDPLMVAPLAFAALVAFEAVAPLAAAARALPAVRSAGARVLDVAGRAPIVHDPARPRPGPGRRPSARPPGRPPAAGPRPPAGARRRRPGRRPRRAGGSHRAVGGREVDAAGPARPVPRARRRRGRPRRPRPAGPRPARRAGRGAAPRPGPARVRLRRPRERRLRPAGGDRRGGRGGAAPRPPGRLARLARRRPPDAGRRRRPALSGGQRQRLAMARAFLADPSVLLLDEPTAHLDAGNAAALLDDLWATAGDRSVVLVTHGPAGPFAGGPTLALAHAGPRAARPAGPVGTDRPDADREPAL